MSYVDTQLHAHKSMVLLEWTKYFMLICLLMRLGGIPFCIFHVHSILLWPSGDNFLFVQYIGGQMSDDKESIDDREKARGQPQSAC